MSLPIYLGERARLAVEYFNENWHAAVPICADGEGWWLITPPATQWDRGKAPMPHRVDDVYVIAQVESGAVPGVGPLEHFEAWIAQRARRRVAHRG